MLRDRLVKTLVPATLLVALALAGSAQAKQFAIAQSYQGLGIASLSVAADGTLTPVAGSPFDVPDEEDLQGMVVSPDAKHVYVAGNGSPAHIFGYAVGADGALSLIGGATEEIGSAAYGVAITPDGRFVYVANLGDDDISAFARAADGSLTELSASPFSTATGPTGFAVSSDGRFLYVAGETTPGTVSVFSIEPDGSLSELAASPYMTTSAPFSLNLTPNGQYLYVAGRGATDQVDGFEVEADGELTQLAHTPPPTGENPFGMTITPDGSRVFTANHGDESINEIAIAADGSLTGVFETPTGVSSTEVTTNAEGTRLFSSNADDPVIDVFALPSGGAALAPISGSPFESGTEGDFQSIALTPDQPPAASFTVKGNRTKTLNGTGTVDPDGGTVARYDWDFGDGTTLANGGPTPTHRYARGTYTATLTVTDDQGCSLTYVSAGETAFCNGSGVARTTRVVDAIPPRLRVTAKRRQVLGKSVKLKATCDEPCNVGARGTIKIAGEGKFKLRSDGVSVEAAGERERLKLRLPKEVRKVADDAERGSAKVKVSARDTTGNKANRKKLRIRLRG